LDPCDAAGDHHLELGCLDRPCSVLKFIERKEAAPPAALQNSVRVEAGYGSASEIRGNGAPGVSQYGSPAIARPGEDDRDGAGADRHQPTDSGSRAEGAAIDVGGQQPHLDLRCGVLALEAD